MRYLGKNCSVSFKVLIVVVTSRNTSGRTRTTHWMRSCVMPSPGQEGDVAR